VPSTEPVAERAVRERPILFSGPMVRAILEDRKTQTRRVMPPLKHPDWTGYMMAREGYAIECGPDYPDDEQDKVRCPYGVAGDRLWVRETLRPSQSGIVTYGEDGCPAWRQGESVSWPWSKTPKVRTAIFMPRWASRILLEIVEVQVQRLQEVSARDCVAEGRSLSGSIKDGNCYFPTTWDAINGKRHSWASNPWVWAITFKRLAT